MNPGNIWTTFIKQPSCLLSVFVRSLPDFFRGVSDSRSENSNIFEIKLAMAAPDKTNKYPLKDYKNLCFLKNIIKNPNIIVGDFTYYDDIETTENFEKNVKYHFDFIGDKLIIGKFCMIASDTIFIMNGGNHLSESISCFPFAIFGEDCQNAMKGKSYPTKGDTIIENDVWIGFNVTIMPGVRVGNGAILAANSVITKDVGNYCIVGGNPAVLIRKRFPEEIINKLINLKWWDWEVDRITQNLHALTGSDLSIFLHGDLKT